MSLINNSTGFQIHGGNFYQVSGDVNLETHQHLLIQDHTRHDTSRRLPVGSALTPEEGSDAGSRRSLSSVARNPRYEMRGRPAPYALSSRPRLDLRGSSNVGEYAHLESSSSASLSRQPELGFRPVPECLSEFRQPATLPSIDPGSSESDVQSSHPRDYRHSTVADLTSSRSRQRQNCRTEALPPWVRVQSASDFQHGPQGPHY
ncbi:hypothetical protein FB451DRAFT_722542 [Mycena latifolia]|nr:hypothetical protein FB451DRAFT_722542 [Mycena latifolia]